MTVLGWDELLRQGLPGGRPVWLTVGVFDGVHLGHQRLLTEITAEPSAARSLVVTFRSSPALVTAPQQYAGAVVTHRQKLERMAERGVETVVVIDFSDEMSNLSGEAFVRLLRENLTIQKIVVGQNFRFGKKRTSGTDDLREMLSDTATELLVAAPVTRNHVAISSSRVRSAIAAGRLDEAREMLGVAHTIDSRGLPWRAGPVGGSGDLRVARAAVAQVLPPSGEYRVRVAGRAAGAGSADAETTCRIDDEWLTVDRDGQNVAGYRDGKNVTDRRDGNVESITFT